MKKFHYLNALAVRCCCCCFVQYIVSWWNRNKKWKKNCLSFHILTDEKRCSLSYSQQTKKAFVFYLFPSFILIFYVFCCLSTHFLLLFTSSYHFTYIIYLFHSQFMTVLTFAKEKLNCFINYAIQLK